MVKLEPISKIHIGLGIDPHGRGQKVMTNSCYNHMDKYVPMDNGDLRTDVTLYDDKIVYEVPYAHAQYIGVVNGSPVVNYTTDNTGPYWDKVMVANEINMVVKEVQDAIRR